MPPDTPYAASMDSSHAFPPAPAPSYHLQPKLHGPGSPLYTILITTSLIFLLVSALGMHFLIRCALRCWLRRSRAGMASGSSHVVAKTEESHKIELGLLPIAVYDKLAWPAAAAPPSSRERDSQCPICLSDFRNGEKMRVLPVCGHGFHVKCLDAWLSSHPSCPTCRFDLTTLSTQRV